MQEKNYFPNEITRFCAKMMADVTRLKLLASYGNYGKK